LTGNWFHIAKAEFQVQTSGIKSHRKPIVLGLFVLGIVWALVIAPYLMAFVFTEILGIPQPVLIVIMPGLMRAGIMFIWLILLILPLSNALQEVKIGQWEILLSNNVQTREILVGVFVGRLSVYGLYILYLALLLVAPFAQALDVSPVGQALMYVTVFVITVSIIWLSQLLVTAI
jgi:MFS family permease